MAVSSALQEVRIFSSFLRQGLSGWKLRHDINNSAYIVSGVRFYRGSNRDTRRRERNLRAKLKKREPEEPMVFDKKEFFRQNYDKELFSFKSRLGLEFHDEKILLAAFTHESYEVDHVGDDSDNNKTLQSRENNTKLSLLGLTATSLYIVDHLCTTYPSLPRLGIRCFHDFLVGRSNIVKLCNQISLPDLIRLEHDLDDLHKEKHLDYRKEDVISDTFFALVGAIYVDQGPVEARRFVEDFVIAQLQGEELHKILHFDYPEKVLENIFTIQGKEKPVARRWMVLVVLCKCTQQLPGKDLFAYLKVPLDVRCLGMKSLESALHVQGHFEIWKQVFTQQEVQFIMGRVIQETGVTSPVPVYVVGVFSGDDMIAEASSYTVVRAKNEALKAALMKHCQEGMLLPFPNERNQADRVSQ